MLSAILIAVLAVGFDTVACKAPPLEGPYKVSDITSSGVSSGGFMATQVHVAFSSVINGSAVFAAVSDSRSNEYAMRNKCEFIRVLIIVLKII